jgi:hypothetical protein
MDRLLRGDLLPGGKCDVKTLTRESGIDRTTFYGNRPYAHLREEFETHLATIRQTKSSPDSRDAQADRLKAEIATLKDVLSNGTRPSATSLFSTTRHCLGSPPSTRKSPGYVDAPTERARSAGYRPAPPAPDHAADRDKP